MKCEVGIWREKKRRGRKINLSLAWSAFHLLVQLHVYKTSPGKKQIKAFECVRSWGALSLQVCKRITFRFFSSSLFKDIKDNHRNPPLQNLHNNQKQKKCATTARKNNMETSSYYCLSRNYRLEVFLLRFVLKPSSPDWHKLLIPIPTKIYTPV